MEDKKTVYLGIDISSSRKPFTYVALDDERRLLALGQCRLEELLAYATGQSTAIIGINAPSKPNLGLVKQDEIQKRLPHLPPPGQRTNLRLVEYELYHKGIRIPRTPSTANDCPKWMRQGFILYQRLQYLGYKPYPTKDASRQWLEVQAKAAYWSLIGKLPLKAKLLEGRLQRQLVLYDLGLPVPDPIRFFEEITRFRLFQGILPLQDLYNSKELNALIIAYTTWLVINKPGRISRQGAPEEGEIILPLKKASHTST